MATKLPPREIPPLPKVPFELLPQLDDESKRRARAVALRANAQYVQAFLEEYSFCPFSRGGRVQGQTAVYVHFAESNEMQPLVDLVAELAPHADKVVIQVIFPMIDVSAEDWRTFCHELTNAANMRLPQGETYAVAPLHPGLSYRTTTPYTLIPLFRRAPDPTIQWVRLDGLEQIYAGRSRKDIYIPPELIQAYLAKPYRKPLFDQIAETNMKMAIRLGIEFIENTLSDISKQAQLGYRSALLGEESLVDTETMPEYAKLPLVNNSKKECETRSALMAQDEHYGLAYVRDLPQYTPVHFSIDQVDLVVIRTKSEVHVLHGKCPHRGARLDSALVENDHLVCAFHGWDFRLTDGKSEGVPGESIHHFNAQIVDGVIWIDAKELRLFSLEESGFGGHQLVL